MDHPDPMDLTPPPERLAPSIELPSSALQKPDLKSMSVDDLAEFFATLSERRFRADQLFQAIHAQGVVRFEDVTTFPLTLRQKLSQIAVLGGMTLDGALQSTDGTIKLLMRTAQNDRVESVLIPADDRMTQCISSQVGCKMGCTFCLTATMPLRRNLRPSEIVDQVYHARRYLNDSGKKITNVVYMGMGEPLDNFVGVVKSARLLMHPNGAAFGARRITVSTSGLAPRMQEFLDLLPVKLALSLNASDNRTRSAVMPVNRKYDIAEVLAVLESRPWADRQRLTIEYVMLGGVNDTELDARRLANLVRKLGITVNLIPFNPFEGAAYRRPDEDRVNQFARVLVAEHVAVTVRQSRGRDIGAACGMLDGVDGT